MKKTLLIFVIIYSTLLSQGDPLKRAEFHNSQGWNLLQEDSYQDAAAEFQNAMLADPENIIYAYNYSLSLYKAQKYRDAIKVLDSLSKSEAAFEQIFQLLGNSYDYLGRNDKAIDSYQAGLSRFPNSGRLYMELGLVELNRTDTIRALEYWENAVRVEPEYDMIYYRLAKFYNMVDDDVLSILYSELYLNLTSDLTKFREINKLLYDKYQEIFVIDEETGLFETNINLFYRPTIDSRYLTYFSAKTVNVYIQSYFLSLEKEQKKIDITDIIAIRKKFLELWYEQEMDKEYPNPLVEFQSKVLKANMFDIYSVWLMSEGEPENFKAWLSTNSNLYDEFLTWLSQNRFSLAGVENYTAFFYTPQFRE